MTQRAIVFPGQGAQTVGMGKDLAEAVPSVKVLEARGRFMQEACEAREGGMVSVIGLADEPMQQVVAATGVEVANLNSEGQTVLSGPREAVAEAARLASDAGAKRAIVLKVAGAYHSSLMEPAAQKLGALLADVDIVAPRIPVMANATGRAHGTPDEIREAMVRQVTSTVRWLDCVRVLQGMGVSEYLECGPGKVLSGLIKRIDRSATVHSIQDCSTLDGADT